MDGRIVARGSIVLTPTAWWIAVEPVDLRRGMDGLLASVAGMGRDAFDGAAYVFRNRAGTRIKVVCADGEPLPGVGPR